jgi:hypothetical protein
MTPKVSTFGLSADILAHSGGYLKLEKFSNNEFRLTINSRLPGRASGGNNWENRQLEILASKLEREKNKLITELNDKKYQLSKLRKKYETTGDKSIWDKKAGLELEVIELEHSIYNNYSEYFGPSNESPLGITQKLQESLKNDLLNLSDSVFNSTKSSNKINFHSSQKTLKFLANQLNSLVNKKNSKKEFTAKRKPSKISKLAQHRILELGAIIEKRDGKNQFFITLTVPGDTDEIKKAIANFSPYIDLRLTQCIRDCKKLYGWDVSYIMVWENMKSGKLHKHIIISSNKINEKQLREVSEKIGQTWENILDSMATVKPIRRGNYSGFLPGLDMYKRNQKDIEKKHKNITTWANHKDTLKELANKQGGKIFVNIQRVTKSAARYLSKYVSKGSQKDNNFNPARWWQASKDIRDLAKKERSQATFTNDSSKIEKLIFVLNLLENQGLIKKVNKNYWDIFAVVNSDGISKRINKKPSEAIPHNSRRVSRGVQFIVYYNENCSDYIKIILENLIKNLSEFCKSNEVTGKKYLNQDELIDINDRISAPGINQKIAINHRNYWLEIIENAV